MVTKKEIEDDCKKQIANLEKEREALLQEHKEKGFDEEDKKIQDAYSKIKNIDFRMSHLMEKSFQGNWGSSANRYNSRIPQNFVEFCNKNQMDYGYDSSMKIALNELQKKKEEDLLKSPEYMELREQRVELDKKTYKNEYHGELDKKIGCVEESIGWLNRKIQRVQDKGEFIQLAKHLKDEERKAQANKIKQEQVQKCIDFIKSQEGK